MKKENILQILREDWKKARSTWERAVIGDAFDLVAQCEAEDLNIYTYDKILLNGADNWNQYSWGGCALIYNGDIAKHYCTPSELKKTRNGLRRPNSQEDWLDVQARALTQACGKVGAICYRAYIGGVK